MWFHSKSGLSCSKDGQCSPADKSLYNDECYPLFQQQPGSGVYVETETVGKNQEPGVI